MAPSATRSGNRQVCRTAKYQGGRQRALQPHGLQRDRASFAHHQSAAGTPAALPPKALLHYGCKGKIYHNPGVANNDFLQVCGKDCEDTYLPASPIVAAQLPDDHPVKHAVLEYVTRFEERYGKGSVTMFGSQIWDAVLLLNGAVSQALRKAPPGTREFRHALRRTLEHVKDLM
jgi:branched-chain amino acid transport system substrate-binding protein